MTGAAGIGDPASVGIALTLGADAAALALHRRAGVGQFVNPTILTIAMVSAILAITGIPYASYMHGGATIHFVLGIAVVLLAVPLVDEGRRVSRAMPVLLVAILIALPFGGAVGAATAMLLGADLELVRSLLPRSITAGVSGVTGERIGGIAALAGLAALLTGVATSILGPSLLRAVGARSPTAFGLTMGLHGHALGVAQSGIVRPDSLPYARIGMSSAMIAGAILIPLLQASEDRPLQFVKPAMAAIAPPAASAVAERERHVPWILATVIAASMGAPMRVTSGPRVFAMRP